MSVAPAYLPYASSLDPTLKLFATFVPRPEPMPLLLCMHGWHGGGKLVHADDIPTTPTKFFMVWPDMRGRADSGGRPDANGYELQDAVDALDAAKRHFPGHADTQAHARLAGGSGGGGNVLGIIGKFPDMFPCAVSECGISDYALWFAHDSVGEFRDEMEGKDWIGGTPQTNPEAYLSRGGRTTAMNLMLPLLMFHGEVDPRVPIEQPRAYIAAAMAHGRGKLITSVFYPGVGDPGHYGGEPAGEASRRNQAIQEHLVRYATRPALPVAGRLVVAGYLRTRHFSVALESADQVAILDYDLTRGESDWAQLRAPSCRRARVQLTRMKDEGVAACAAITLERFCEEVKVPHPARHG